MSFPKQINFESANPKGLTTEAQDWLERIRNEVEIFLLDEKTIQIKYPHDIISRISVVNIDDTIYRLDLIDKDDKFWTCNSIFPNVPWNGNHKFFQNMKGIRTAEPDKLTIKYENY